MSGHCCIHVSKDCHHRPHGLDFSLLQNVQIFCGARNSFVLRGLASFLGGLGGGGCVKVASAKFRLRMSELYHVFALYALLEWTATVVSSNGHELCLT